MIRGHEAVGSEEKPNCCHPESPLGVRDLLLDFAVVGAPACCARPCNA
jgi:hypothetical protein